MSCQYSIKSLQSHRRYRYAVYWFLVLPVSNLKTCGEKATVKKLNSVLRFLQIKIKILIFAKYEFVVSTLTISDKNTSKHLSNGNKIIGQPELSSTLLWIISDLRLTGIGRTGRRFDWCFARASWTASECASVRNQLLHYTIILDNKINKLVIVFWSEHFVDFCRSFCLQRKILWKVTSKINRFDEKYWA